MKDTKKDKAVAEGIERIRADVREERKADYIRDTEVEEESEAKEVDNLLIKDRDELNQELVKVDKEWDVTQLDIGVKEGGFKKIIAFIYRRLLNITLNPYTARFLHKQAQFNSSAVRCLHAVTRILGGLEARLTSLEARLTSLEARLTSLEARLSNLENHVEVISVNIRNNNRLIKDMQKAIDNNSEWLDLFKMKSEAHTAELKKLKREYEDTINRSKSQDDLRFKKIEGWLKVIREKVDINLEE